MNMLRLLLLSWLLQPLCAAAQTRPAGPWRVRYELRREKTNAWATSPDDTTTVRRQRTVELVPWNSKPAAITLFLHCNNPLLAPAAARYKAAAIRFVATGATLQRTPAWLWVVPFAPVVVLRAYRQHRLLFRHTFRAVLPPPPPSTALWTVAQPGLPSRIANAWCAQLCYAPWRRASLRRCCPPMPAIAWPSFA